MEQAFVGRQSRVGGPAGTLEGHPWRFSQVVLVAGGQASARRRCWIRSSRLTDYRVVRASGDTLEAAWPTG